MKKFLMLGILVAGAPSCLSQESSENGWDIAVWIAAATGEEHANSFLEAQTLSAGIFIGRAITAELGSGWRRGRLEYGFELMPVFVQFKPGRIAGGGFAPIVLRWNPALRFTGARPYIELAGGALKTDGNLPSGDTSNFNFTASGGGGLYLPVRPQQFVDFGIRWRHISNANLGTRNPEFNGIEIRVGYHWMK